MLLKVGANQKELLDYTGSFDENLVIKMDKKATNLERKQDSERYKIIKDMITNIKYKDTSDIFFSDILKLLQHDEKNFFDDTKQNLIKKKFTDNVITLNDFINNNNDNIKIFKTSITDILNKIKDLKYHKDHGEHDLLAKLNDIFLDYITNIYKLKFKILKESLKKINSYYIDISDFMKYIRDKINKMNEIITSQLKIDDIFKNINGLEFETNSVKMKINSYHDKINTNQTKYNINFNACKNELDTFINEQENTTDNETKSKKLMKFF